LDVSMTEAWNRGEDASRAAAADWLVRLQAPDLDASAALAFDAWLAEHPANPAAYDAVLAVTLEIEAAAAGLARAIEAAPVRRPGRERSQSFRRGWLVAGGLAAAATIALAVMPLSAFEAGTQTFATAKGEHRTVKLADGSTVDLNAGSRLSVTLARHERRIILPEGEAVFDVAADTARPFLIAAGDRTVRVVGTRFDVRRRSGLLSVTVERGVVEVLPSAEAAGRAYRLHPGQRLDHIEGARGVQVSAADPAQVFSWKSGRLIYRDQPLGEVIADLNQQFPRPIRLEDPALAQTRVSGVLVLDNQEAVIRRLALLAPIRALVSQQGIVLRSDPAAKP
jgi:transmembrane sensor